MVTKLERVYLVKATPFSDPFIAFVDKGSAVECFKSLTHEREDASEDDYIVSVPMFASVQLEVE